MAGVSKPTLSRLASGLRSASIRLLRGLRRSDSRFGVGPARLSALSVLVYAGPQTPSELAEIEQVRSPTMTKVLRGLAEQGLARIEASPDDGRSKIASATARGRRLLERARQARVDRLESALATLPREDRAVLQRAVKILQGLPVSSE